MSDIPNIEDITITTFADDTMMGVARDLVIPER